MLSFFCFGFGFGFGFGLGFGLGLGLGICEKQIPHFARDDNKLCFCRKS